MNSYVSLTSALQGLPAVVTVINQLPLTLGRERAFRDQVISLIDDAQNASADGQYDVVIDDLVSSVDKLKRMRAAETNDIRYQLDLAIKEAEWQWSKAQ